MKTAKTILLSGLALTLASCGSTVTKVTSEKGIPQTEYAASLVSNYIPSMQKGYKINIQVADNNEGLTQEGFTITRKGKKINAATMRQVQSTEQTVCLNFSTSTAIWKRPRLLSTRLK